MAQELTDYFDWHDASHELPPEGALVLIEFTNGRLRLASIFEDVPSWEDTYQAYFYFDDPEDEGQDWQMDDIARWKYIE